MTDVCIVCLGDLRIRAAEDGDVDKDKLLGAEALAHTTAPLPMVPEESKNAIDDEVIAHLLPCGHNLHDSCLRPWVERANSCPICRAAFHVVELRNFLDGPAHSSYAVQEKQQQAEVDPTLIIDDTLFDDEDPCMVCGALDNNHEFMYCDACDGTVHIFCAGFSNTDAPDIWYCETCLRDLGTTAHPGRRTAPRTTQTRQRRGRRGSESWERVWATVWNRLNLDLDFPYDDDEPATVHRTPAQRRELAAWNRRLHVANRQGASNRFRDTAPALLDRRNRPDDYAPESQEELRAWNAFDKAKKLDDDQRPTSSRKRKSTTTSPASPRDQPTSENAEPERKLKRPRTRRNQIIPEPGPSTTEVPMRPSQRPAEGPSFLTQLLKEVEKQPAPVDAASPDGEGSGDEQQGLHLSSPEASPFQSPRALSVTPPPYVQPRPSSPTPLTSIVRPLASPVFSPIVNNKDDRGRSRRRPQNQVSSPPRDISPGSPSHNMSYSTKQEIQRMVKAALGSRYRDQEVTKDQYTEINREVSRMLYEKIGDAEGLADQKEREKWQKMAMEEVEKAVQAIRSQEEQSAESRFSSEPSEP